MVLFGIFKKKRKGDPPPSKKDTPVTNSQLSTHPDTTHPIEPKHTTTTTKQPTTYPNQNISNTVHSTSNAPQDTPKTIKDKQIKHKDDDDPNEWIFETIRQYLTSPLWKVPIFSFIDENCIIFDNEEENKFEYTDVHKKFKQMIEDMLSALLDELGITEELFLQVVNKGLGISKHKKVFEQLLVADNFIVFKKLMLKRNKELELEALHQLEEQGTLESHRHHSHQHGHHDSEREVSRSKEIEKLNLQKEQAEIEEAIARSLAIEQEKLKLQEREDKELQQALRESQREFELMQELENRRIQDEEQKEYLKKLNKNFLQEKTREQPKTEVQKPKDEEVSKKKAVHVEENIKPVEELVMKEKKTPEKEVVHEQVLPKDLPSLSEKKKLEAIGGAEERKERLVETTHSQWKGAILPPIKRKDYDAFSNEELMKEREQIANKLYHLEAEKKLEVTQEGLQERKKRLQAQRELILKKKQEEREAELKRFQQEHEEENILDSQLLGGLPSVETKEMEKRRAIYQKLKQNLHIDTAPFKID